MTDPSPPPPVGAEAAALAEQVLAVEVAHVEGALHRGAGGTAHLPVLAVGLAASPGTGSGPLVTSVGAALDAFDRGEDPVLVAEQTSPADEPAMRVAAAVVTARGGLASHAAVVARGWGLPAVCGAETISVDGDGIRVGDRRVAEGEWLTVDGSSGEIRLGAAGSGGAPGGLDGQLLAALDAADRLAAGRPAVWANADTADDARRARELGARGIGLCRTEHQFLGDRLPLLQEVLLRGPEATDATAELERLQRSDAAALLEAMDGLPVTFRLLDPPLHEFLPRHGDASADPALLALADLWREENPMLGVRGVRLAVLRPDLLALQVRSLAGAAADRRAAGGRPVPRLLVPMVAHPGEMDLVAEAVRFVPGAEGIELGAMVETPAAALRVGELRAGFLSLGTNDLTQLTLGESRDDVEARLLGPYREAGILSASPFESLDPAVVELVGLTVERAGGRPVGICGEQAADPASLAACRAAGVGTVSCSPFRVPVARLLAGRAAAAELRGTV
ncbi:MAG: putative PEP-binding protein [Microthrixaceae bacterium]